MKKEEKQPKTRPNKKVPPEKKGYPKKQFYFVIGSLLLLIGLGLFFAGRSIYYYSGLNQKKKIESNIVATNVKNNNPIVTEGNGLYQSGEEYVFKGTDVNNYVMYSNQLFRIMRILEDNSIKLVSADNVNTLMWGDDTDYLKSNLYRWLNDLEEEHTGIYFSSLDNVPTYLNKTEWCLEELNDGKIKCINEPQYDFISQLTLSDYNNALGKDSYLNIGKYTYLLGQDTNDSVLYINEEGTIKEADTQNGYGVRPVITLKGQLDVISGNGTKESPYIFSESSNYTNKFVKLDEDMWRIFKETETHLYLSKEDYLKVKGQDYYGIYSTSTSEFSYGNRKNLAYYLNNTYLNSLSYKDHLSTCTFDVGEISNGTGFDYKNVYTDKFESYVGLLNLVDLKLNNNLEDYFLLNRTSDMGEMEYVHITNNKLVEEVVSEKKRVVPVICLEKSKIVNGNGTLEVPYTVE